MPSRNMADRMVPQKAKLAVSGDNDDDMRITEVAWLEHTAESAALYEHIGQVVRKLNQEITALR
jgi:hypothetical protein